MRTSTEKILYDFTVKTMISNGMSREDAETYAKASIKKKLDTLKKIKFEH